MPVTCSPEGHFPNTMRHLFRGFTTGKQGRAQKIHVTEARVFGSVQREPRPTRNQRCFQDKVDVKTLKNKSVMDQFLNYKAGVACGANAMRKVLPKMYSQPRRGPDKQSP